METATQPRAGALGASAPALVLRGLRRDYGERPVLRNLELELPQGRTLAVIGPNGAGKSTLLRILATLLRPTAGQVSVLGASLPREVWKVRGRIGYLGHEPLLYRELSVRENLEFNARLQGVEAAGERIAKLLDRAGLGRRGGELVRNLSAGMLQRAAICRALLHEPELLLLDEPRSHLDLGAGAIVDELLGPAPGRTRVIVTHEIEAGLADADTALALRADGSVAHAGPASALSPGDARAIFEGRA
jgi:heme exporter protein A